MCAFFSEENNTFGKEELPSDLRKASCSLALYISPVRASFTLSAHYYPFWGNGDRIEHFPRNSTVQKHFVPFPGLDIRPSPHFTVGVLTSILILPAPFQRCTFFPLTGYVLFHDSLLPASKRQKREQERKVYLSPTTSPVSGDPSVGNFSVTSDLHPHIYQRRHLRDSSGCSTSLLFTISFALEKYLPPC